MNLTGFLKQIDQLVNECTQDQLTAFIHEMARLLPEEKRMEFINQLRAVAKTNGNSGKRTENEQENIQERYEKLSKELEEIEEKKRYFYMELNEEYDDWYNSDVEEFFYEDPDKIADTIADVCDLVHQCVDRENYGLGMEMGRRLFALEVQAGSDYGEDTLDVEEMVRLELLQKDLKKIALDTLYSIYQSENKEERAGAIYEVICNTGMIDLCIENLMQYGSELNDFEGFLEDWIAYLGNERGKTAENLFLEAVGLINNLDSAFEYAKKYVSVHPGLFLELLVNDNEQNYEKMLEIGSRGIELIDKKYVVRSEVALKTAEIALAVNDVAYADKCYMAAYESNTNAVNYLRVLLNCENGMEHKVYLQKLLEGFSDRKLDNYYGFHSSEDAENNPSRNMIYILEFLNGDFIEVMRKGLSEKEALGWSRTFMKEGLAIYMLFLYNGKKLGSGIKKMLANARAAFHFTKEEYEKGLKDSFREDDTELFYQCFLKWKETILMDENDKTQIISHMEEMIDKRVTGIMNGNRRNYYEECAALIAALGEVKESRGEVNGKQQYMEFYRSSYSRRTSFRAELARYGWKN